MSVSADIVTFTIAYAFCVLSSLPSTIDTVARIISLHVHRGFVRWNVTIDVLIINVRISNSKMFFFLTLLSV